MGMDIHIYLAKEGEKTKEIEFGGRNSEWFDNMMGDRGYDDCYDYLDLHYELSPFTDKEIVEQAEEWEYFSPRYVRVDAFKYWFEKYRPHISAGWVSTYDMWRIKNKGYIPEDMNIAMDPNKPAEDQHFVEVVNIYDCSLWLYNYLVDNKICDDAHITYFFDH